MRMETNYQQLYLLSKNVLLYNTFRRPLSSAVERSNGNAQTLVRLWQGAPNNQKRAQFVSFCLPFY